MQSWAWWLSGILLAIGASGATLLYRRRARLGAWLMNKFLEGLTAKVLNTVAAFTELTDLVTVAIGPHVRTLLAPAPDALLDPALVRAVLGHAGQVLGGYTVTYAPMGVYTAAEVERMTLSLVRLTRAVVDTYALPVPRAQLEQLLSSVTARILAEPVSAPALVS